MLRRCGCWNAAASPALRARRDPSSSARSSFLGSSPEAIKPRHCFRRLAHRVPLRAIKIVPQVLAILAPCSALWPGCGRGCCRETGSSRTSRCGEPALQQLFVPRWDMPSRSLELRLKSLGLQREWFCCLLQGMWPIQGTVDQARTLGSPAVLSSFAAWHMATSVSLHRELPSSMLLQRSSLCRSLCEPSGASLDVDCEQVSKLPLQSARGLCKTVYRSNRGQRVQVISGNVK